MFVNAVGSMILLELFDLGGSPGVSIAEEAVGLWEL